MSGCLSVLISVNSAAGGDETPGQMSVTAAASPTNTLTPDLVFGYPEDAIEAGWVLRVQNSDDDFGTSDDYLEYTLTSQDVIDIGNEDPITYTGVNALSGAGTWKFRCRLENGAEVGEWSEETTVIVDLTAPTFDSSVPADNDTDVAVDATIVITFSEQIEAGATAGIEIRLTSDDTLVEAFDETDFGTALSITFDELTITPTSDFDGGEEFYVLIDAGSVQDLAGNAFAGIASTTALSFTVEGGASGSTAALTLTASGNINQDATSAGALTISADIGTAGANRKVLFVGVKGNSYDAPVTAVSINGVTCTGGNGGGLQATFTGSGAAVGVFSGDIFFAWADVPSGSGAQNIVVTGGVNAGNGLLVYAVYTLDKTLLLDVAPTFDASGNNVTGVTSNTVSANTGDGGFVIAVNVCEILGSATSVALTSATESMGAADVGPVSNQVGPIHSKKSGVAVATPFSATFGWTNNSQSLAALMHWR